MKKSLAAKVISRYIRRNRNTSIVINQVFYRCALH